MSHQHEAPPEGRYGRSGGDEARTDRRLKLLGAVLGAAFLGLIGWIGFSHISSGSQISGELIKFQVVSDEEVRAHLEVRKGSDVEGVCAVRALSEDKAEVGRADFAFDGARSRIDEVVSLRTTARATSAQLLRCQRTDGD
ncbi:DUF4307 domain-containing protein [Streptomyces sp. 549]|uniref:DUF4307 domain-containing protein n=1 Tax=Streptomyces sp. 549 TaxID=3049076 RepID=UPI0024C3D1BC|nr:DUF4307 domain-containing protein [Streptomyces sp. 549]MDK1472646.1 DUF4307 domain-containing protein [Streptomyces sp. 549]